MKSTSHFFSRVIRQAYKDERGQVLPFVMLLMVSLLGMAALVIDLGHAYFCYRELQAATDAAALAGAQGLPSDTAAKAQALLYSAVTGNKNARTNLTGVTMVSGYPQLKCLTTLTNQGVACISPSNANAIVVKEQVDVPMYFASIFGISTLHENAIATAAMRGAITRPYNVAIILDSTTSMATLDSNCGNVSRLSCALGGVQVLLKALTPCAASYTTCSVTAGVATNSVDRVALFTFPNVTVGTAANDYNCSGSNPTIPVYSLPPTNGSTYAPSGSGTATYQVTPFLSDYRTSDTASSLNLTSNLSLAIGAKSGCPGMGSPGGDGTYYAGVLYAAQGALLAEQVANPGSQNVIVMLSDGDASASSSKMAPKTTDGTVSLNSTGTYPSSIDQCSQAVVAAKAIAAAGTKIYSVAYGSSASGCSTDTTGTYAGITPCQTMEYIASAASNFFSDYNQSGSGSTCQSASQPTTSISQIFTQIANDFTFARLIPDNTP